jgi:hypothetical protein
MTKKPRIVYNKDYLEFDKETRNKQILKEVEELLKQDRFMIFGCKMDGTEEDACDSKIEDRSISNRILLLEHTNTMEVIGALNHIVELIMKNQEGMN